MLSLVLVTMMMVMLTTITVAYDPRPLGCARDKAEAHRLAMDLFFVSKLIFDTTPSIVLKNQRPLSHCGHNDLESNDDPIMTYDVPTDAIAPSPSGCARDKAEAHRLAMDLFFVSKLIPVPAPLPPTQQQQSTPGSQVMMRMIRHL
jgi:hypothetical protein